MENLEKATLAYTLPFNLEVSCLCRKEVPHVPLTTNIPRFVQFHQ